MPPRQRIPPRTTRAFTLIELLVVISIIGLLAALLLPVLGRMKTKVKITETKREMTQLVTAIKHFESQYSAWPCRKAVWNCSAANVGNKDFTFGTTRSDGSLLRPDYPAIVTYQLNSVTPTSLQYQTNNAEVIGCLRTAVAAPTKELEQLSTIRNSRQQSFFEAKAVSQTDEPGIGPDGVLRDIWGNPYIITLDIDGNGQIVDGFYAGLRKKAKLSADRKGEILIWSFGPDGKVDTSATAEIKGGDNKDNILSTDF